MRADVYNDVGEVVTFFMILKGDEDELTTQLALLARWLEFWMVVQIDNYECELLSNISSKAISSEISASANRCVPSPVPDLFFQMS